MLEAYLGRRERAGDPDGSRMSGPDALAALPAACRRWTSPCRSFCACARRRIRKRSPFARKEHGVWKRFTWAHYYETARLVAAGLSALRLKHRGDRIAIASENTPEWYYADLGANARRAGHRHLSDQPVAGTVIYRAPLRERAWCSRGSGADRQGAGRHRQWRWPARRRDDRVRRHEGHAQLPRAEAHVVLRRDRRTRRAHLPQTPMWLTKSIAPSTLARPTTLRSWSTRRGTTAPSERRDAHAP